MPNTIKLKRNSTAGQVPSSLAEGELAINTADEKLFIKNASGAIVEIQGAGGGATSGSFPFYGADGSSDTIAVTSGSFPFYKADGTQDNIGV